MRKKMGSAQLVEVSEDKEEKKPDPVVEAVAMHNQYYYPYPPLPSIVYDQYLRLGTSSRT